MIGNLLPAGLLALVCLILPCTSAVRADTVIVTADRMVDVLTGQTVDHPPPGLGGPAVRRPASAAPRFAARPRRPRSTAAD